MGRVNDVGGMQGFPPLEQELDEPPFHSDWEAHVFALNRALIGRGVYNLDEFRDAVETMPPQQYLACSYYEKWFHAVATLCVRKGVLTQAEIAAGSEAGSAAGTEAETVLEIEPEIDAEREPEIDAAREPEIDAGADGG